MSRAGKIDPAKRHQRLAELSKRARELVAEGANPAGKRLTVLETQIDENAATVWGITATELSDIQFSLSDLK